MAATKTITLEAPVELPASGTAPAKTITDLVMKAPSGGNFIDIGEPFISSQTRDGARFDVEDMATIRKYLDVCVDLERTGITRGQVRQLYALLGLADSRAAKAAVIGFFAAARDRIAWTEESGRRRRQALKASVSLHGATISAVVLKEPEGDGFLEIGEPYIVSRTADNGTTFCVEDKQAIRRYLDLCIVHENAGDVVRLLDLGDAIAVKECLLSFFVGAAASSET